MADYFEQLVSRLDCVPLSIDVLQQITLLLEQQTLPDFLSQAFVTLEQWAWQALRQCDHADYSTFFYRLGEVNKKLIFIQDGIDLEMKEILLLPSTVELIDEIFQKIEQRTDDNDPYISLVALWLDNLSFLLHEYPQLNKSPMIVHINEYFAEHFLMSEQFRVYLTQVALNRFTNRQLFYVKSCSFSLNAYFYTNPQQFPYTTEQMLAQVGGVYLQMIQQLSATVESWGRECLTAVAHLIGFVRAFIWWEGENGAKIKFLFPTEQSLCDYIQALICIIAYEPFHQQLMSQWFNDETILMDAALLALMNIVQSQNINWFFRSIKQLPDLLLGFAEAHVYYRIYLCAYGILSEILTDEHLKELKITDSIRVFFFNVLVQAWEHPTKKYKQIPISYLLRGFLNLSKNDFIQQDIALYGKTSFLVEMCDQYPIIYDILWGLSFNKDIQQQLRSSSLFMSKLAHLANDSNNEQMRKITHGILWNLDRPSSSSFTIVDTQSQPSFDIMISYSHKDKVLCKQLYEHLIQAGYRVWIDFDQMHGNVMDAMAQAIEHSQMIIICMSEQYRRSNFCRAEAHYAFQRQLKLVPVLLQKHYKPDGWLLFLIGQLLYVDFTKYEFGRAIEMLMKEIKTGDSVEVAVPSKSVAVSNMMEWTTEEMQAWLVEHHLPKMRCLLDRCDGRSVMYLHRYMKQVPAGEMLRLLEEDARRQTKESVSLTELCRFQSLIDREKRLLVQRANNPKKDS